MCRPETDGTIALYDTSRGDGWRPYRTHTLQLPVNPSHSLGSCACAYAR
jgi:hypothetical protein